MAKARIGHFVEAQILEALGVDFIDESEVLTPPTRPTTSTSGQFTVPFVCGATNLGEALRRISEGAAMIRSKGEAGTGNVVEAVRHLRTIIGDIKKIGQADSAELFEWAKRSRPRCPSCRRSPRPASCRCPCSAPAASPPRPTPRSRCSSAPRPCSSARASSRATSRPPRRRHRRGHHPLQRRADPRQGQPRAGRPDDRHRHGRDQRPLRRARVVMPVPADGQEPPGGARRRCARAAGRVRIAPATAR
jgi:hypothetical protein